MTIYKPSGWCIQSHTSDAAKEPGTGADWELYWEKITTTTIVAPAWALSQSYQTDVEISVLAAVPNQIVGPGQNRPVIGLVQDSIIGSALMTGYNTFLTIIFFHRIFVYLYIFCLAIILFPTHFLSKGFRVK